MDFTRTKRTPEHLLQRVLEFVQLVEEHKQSESKKAIRRFLDRMSDKGDFSATELSIIQIIGRLGGSVPLNLILDQLRKGVSGSVSSSTIAQIITKLKRRRVLRKNRNPADKRRPLNTLTDEGAKLANELNYIEDTALVKVASALPLKPNQVDDLIRIIAQGIENFRRLTDDAAANIARVYDYVLGGSHHLFVDRERADMIIEKMPWAQQAAKANRGFLQRAVYHLAKNLEIRQFLDIGSGVPTNQNTHEIVQEISSDIKVTYVDNDPDVVRYTKLLLHEEANTCAFQGDLREIQTWLDSTKFQNIDFAKPVVVVLVALLHFLTDDAEASRIIHYLRDKLVSGSFIVLSHGTHEGRFRQLALEIAQDYSKTVAPIKLRDKGEITRLFRGFKLMDPGLVFVDEWMPNLPCSFPDKYDDPEKSVLLVGIFGV